MVAVRSQLLESICLVPLFHSSPGSDTHSYAGILAGHRPLAVPLLAGDWRLLEKGITMQHTGSNRKADTTTPTPKSRMPPDNIAIRTPLYVDMRCAHCNLPLHGVREALRGQRGRTEDSEGGQVFVCSRKGTCHVQVS